MSIPRLLATVLLLVSGAFAQTARPKAADLPPLLGFENNQPADKLASPRGWGVRPAGTVAAVTDIVHTGKWAARITRTASSAQKTSIVTITIPADFVGSTLSFRGYLRTEDVNGFAALFARLDNDSDNFSRVTPQSVLYLSGTHDWALYSLTMPLRRAGKQLLFGAVLSGTGRLWVDDLQLWVDGKPIWQAPKDDRSANPMETDHEFDRSSGIKLDTLTPVQTDNLVTLGKVWGFAKYYDHRVITGKRQWDFDLFRILPSVLAARDSDAGRKAIVDWLRALGPIAPCSPCRMFFEDPWVQLPPPTSWISDPAIVGQPLAKLLTEIHKQRPIDGGRQFYVSLAPGVQNPIFDYELPYPLSRNAYPEPGYQLLALYRLWNIVEYWFPNRNILPENWDSVLREFIPRVVLAKTRDAYQLQLMAFIGKLGDTHANLWSSLNVRPPVGDCYIPVMLRFVDNQAVVTQILPSGIGTTLQRGDVLLDMDGRAVSELVAEWTPYYADSNQYARLRDIAGAMTRGACGPAKLRIRRGMENFDISATRATLPATESTVNSAHDLPGPAFRLLSPDVAYLKLSSVSTDDIPNYLQLAQNTKGWVIDIRNYPPESISPTLVPHMVESATPFARITVGDLFNPGAFHWTGLPTIYPQEPYYPGKVVVLVDEVTQSAAEYVSMAFRAAGATVVGSTTSGADGNFSQILLPGGLTTMFSGIGVFYPDKSPTQQVGIVPDIVAQPTIAGITAGRDEVLESAVRFILGPEASAAQVQAISKP
ncbi:MAG: S41 family peptidase [Acidobacteriota bacterium]